MVSFKLLARKAIECSDLSRQLRGSLDDKSVEKNADIMEACLLTSQREV